MARGVWTRRWLAVSGGLLVNGLVLGVLVLIEEPPPLVGEQPVIVLELERSRRSTAPQPQAASGARSVASAPAQATASEGGEAPAVTTADTTPAPVLDPEWKVDPKVVDHWRLLEGGLGTGRAERACLGQTSEHMTPEEKQACYDAWGKKPDKRQTPTFIGPIDERKWEVPEPKAPPRFDEPRRQRCRDYRRGRTPGFSERNMPTGAPPPSLRERGCF